MRSSTRSNGCVCSRTTRDRARERGARHRRPLAHDARSRIVDKAYSACVAPNNHAQLLAPLVRFGRPNDAHLGFTQTRSPRPARRATTRSRSLLCAPSPSSSARRSVDPSIAKTLHVSIHSLTSAMSHVEPSSVCRSNIYGELLGLGFDFTLKSPINRPTRRLLLVSSHARSFAAGNHSASRGVERDPSAKAREKRGTMQSGESIYNLIPPPEVRQARPRMHKSQHPGTVDPAEFGLGPRRATATFGRAPGDVKPETSKFLRKNTGALNASANTRASPPERFSPVDAFSWGPHTSSVPRWKTTRDVPKPAAPHSSGSMAFPSRPTTNASSARTARGSRLARRTRRRRCFRSPWHARHLVLALHAADPDPPPPERRSESSARSTRRRTSRVH